LKECSISGDFRVLSLLVAGATILWNIATGYGGVFRLTANRTLPHLRVNALPPL